METTLPAIERGQQVHCVLTKDISRGGLSFLHTEQLFPEERIKLWLPIGKHDALIVRCQRGNENCYEIGAVFTSLGHDSSERAQGAMA
jgi:hypothetical protein